jgi:hypothetical protein
VFVRRVSDPLSMIVVMSSPFQGPLRIASDITIESKSAVLPKSCFPYLIHCRPICKKGRVQWLVSVAKVQ